MAPENPPPLTPKDIGVPERIHGVELVDPFSWLEQPSALRERWLDLQNEYTDSFLQSGPLAEIEQRMKELQLVGSFQLPVRRGDLVFQWKKSGGDEFPVLYVLNRAEMTEERALDPHEFEQDRVIKDYISPHGRYIAYGTAQQGNEQTVLRIRDVQIGKDLEETVPNTLEVSVAWLPNETGFYYTRYPDSTDPQHMTKRDVYFHTLGQSAEEDTLIYENTEPGNIWPMVKLSHDQTQIIFSLFHLSGGFDIAVESINAMPHTNMFETVFNQDGSVQIDVVDGYLYAISDTIRRIPLENISQGGWESMYQPEEGRFINPDNWGTFADNKLI